MISDEAMARLIIGCYRKDAFEDVARLLEERVDDETYRCEAFKNKGKHYKAREAAHVARVLSSLAATVRALE